MKIAILGADGYYGFPLYRRLQSNHNVLPLDNFWRRKDIKSPSLLPLHLESEIEFCDVSDFNLLWVHLSQFKPDVVIHLAEQRSAPFSMQNITAKQFTLQNNTSTTLNVMEAARQLDFHTIHIGSMGVYGYDKAGQVAEGDVIRRPGSIYHLSKCIDNSIFELYSRLYGVRVTELHQGVMWGVGGRFDYDHIFGTVVNRFLVQKLCGQDLSLYGKGHQQRAFINIENSLDCVELVLEHNGTGMRSYNQYTEILSLTDIADMISLQQTHIKNPRIENEDNVLQSTNQRLIDMGLDPIFITPKSLDEIEASIQPYINNVDNNIMEPTIQW